MNETPEQLVARVQALHAEHSFSFVLERALLYLERGRQPVPGFSTASFDPERS